MFVEVGLDLIRGAQAGERQALVRLVELYQGPVYSLALAVMRSPSDAADMTQETFVRVLRSIGTFRGEHACFRTWLHRLTVNVCLDALRRKRRAPASLLDATELTANDRWQQPEWSAELRESATEVRAALKELPLPQRVALTLYYFDDSTYEHIAEAMALPINTVKSHLSRGKRNMARLLQVERKQRLTV